MERKTVIQRHRIIDRALSLILVFAIFLLLLQTIPGPLSTVWADEPGGTEQGQSDAVAEDLVSIKVHFNNQKLHWNWKKIYAYVGNFDNGWSEIKGHEDYMKWPGKEVMQNAEHPGFYTFEITKEASSGLAIIFTDCTYQISDKIIYAEELAGVDVYECWVEADGSGLSTTAPDDWDSPIISPEVNGRSATFRYKDSTATSVAVAGSMFPLEENEVWHSETLAEGEGKVFSKTVTCMPGSYEYRFIVDGSSVQDPQNDKVTGKNSDSNNVLIVPGIKDGSMEVARGSSAVLPDALDMILPDGTATQKEVSYTIKTENANGVAYNAERNKITIGSAYTEDTLELTAHADGYAATFTIHISDNPDFFISPKIDGNTVTFRYKDETTSSVGVAGNMFPLDDEGNWTIQTMTEGTDSIFSYTGTFAPGSYEYKLNVDGDWMMDPKNSAAANGNSVFYIAGLISSELTAARGRTTTLPAQLSRMSESGKEVLADVSYTLKTNDPLVTFDAVRRKLTVDSEFTGKTVELTAQSGSETADVLVTVVDDSNEVTLDKTTLALQVGAQDKLSATVKLDNGTDAAVTWSSNNQNVATVDEDGTVHAVSTGTAVITATANDGSGVHASCTVNVSKPAPDLDDVLVTEITLSKQALSMEIGKTEKLTAAVKPSDATNKTVTWTSDTPAVATVDEDGTVHAVSAGTAVITATANDGSGTHASCTVNISKPAPDLDDVLVTEITLSKQALSMEIGKTEKLTAAVKPSDATNKTVTWTSDTPAVATVDKDGTIHAVSAGTAVITAKTAGGLMAACKVTVVIPSTKVLTLPKICIVKGKAKQLSATVIPANSTDKLTWSSSNKKIVSVGKKGKIKGLKTGTAKIKVKTESGKKATCKVTVVGKAKKSSSVKLNKKKLPMKAGTFSQLKVSMKAKSTDTLKFSSSKKKVATVDKNSVVTALKKGTATITVRTSGGKKATCKITVK